LATQSINNGMSLEAVSAMLGHRSMPMTLVYSRIADRTVADEYFAAADKSTSSTPRTWQHHRHQGRTVVRPDSCEV